MNILIQSDENYVDITCVMLCSLFENNKNANFDVYLLHPGINESLLQKIKNQCQAYNNNNQQCVFHSIEVDTSLFSEYTMRSDITNTAFFRTIAFAYLPKNVEKVLYLDSDMIINGSVEEVYNLNFDKDTLFYAGSECRTSQREFSRLGFNYRKILQKRNVVYVNTGVLLMNIKMMRKKVRVEDIFEFIETHKHRMIYKDQDVINGMFFLFIKYFNALKYNFINFSFFPNDEILDLVYQASVLHFAGPNQHKPWCKEFWGFTDVLNIYKKYALKSVVSKDMESLLKVVDKNLEQNQEKRKKYIEEIAKNN